jgi:hypothetical protein
MLRDLDKRLEGIASWEDNETRKDPNTIYLFLSTLGKGLKQRITKASLLNKLF